MLHLQESIGRYNKNIRTADRAPEIASKIVLEMVHNQLQRSPFCSNRCRVPCGVS